MSDEKDLIERSWAVFEAVQRRNGMSTDEVSFVGGFMACYGVLTGRVDIGLPPDTPVVKIFERIQKELEMRRDKALTAMQDNEMRGG